LPISPSDVRGRTSSYHGCAATERIVAQHRGLSRRLRADHAGRAQRKRRL